jgi:hypothetical protein
LAKEAAMRRGGGWLGTLRTAGALACVMVGLLLLPAANVSAERRDPNVKPIPGRWCGLTGTGGTVEFYVLPDGKFIAGLQIVTARATVSTGEGEKAKPYQIKMGQFIFNNGADPAATVARGFFDSPETLHGYFTAPAKRPGPPRTVGNFIAWSSEVSICP